MRLNGCTPATLTDAGIGCSSSSSLRSSLRRPTSFVSASVVGVTIGLAFYVSAYQGLLAGLAALTFLVVKNHRVPERRERIRSLALTSFTYIVHGGHAPSSRVCVLPENRATLDTAVGHTTGDFYAFAARMSAYLVPSPRNPIEHFTRSLHTANLTEQTLFVGYSSMLLALAGVVLLFRRDTWLRSSPTRWWASISIAVLILVAFLFSLPPEYHVGSFPIFTPSVVVAANTTFWRVFRGLECWPASRWRFWPRSR